MSNIIALDDHRPQKAQYCACMACGKDVVSVYPVGTKSLQCDYCKKMTVEPVRIHDADWFDRYMAGAKTRKQRDLRTMVTLNANRMGL